MSGNGGNGICGMIECLEKIIGTPFNDFLDMIKLPGRFVFTTILNNTPTQHSDGKSSRKIELDGISSIIVSTNQILDCSRNTVTLSILHTRSSPPRNIVMLRKFPSCTKPQTLINSR
ncbi:hypothetical protein KIW84_014685 [Lathyrus oleraceus]|uniref:Uncharacterized protein n=1 Tax=Pisum sativum TaxID=3888 RepID=A0A9D5GZL8_PEA|nr:hypothetical protein KIW84_014685 [Pisum sativum]